MKDNLGASPSEAVTNAEMKVDPFKSDDPVGLKFFDNATGKQMKYVYPDSKHWTAGWILYKHPDGQWVTLRKATEADVRRISQAVIGGPSWRTSSSGQGSTPDKL